MANVKISRQVDGFPDNEDFSPIVVPNVPAGTVIRQGSCWALDITQPSISPASLLPVFAPGSSIFFPTYTPTAEVAVPPFSANAGPLIGVYQGPTFTLTTPPLKTALPVKNLGFGLVLVSAEGGNAVNTGSNLIVSATQYGAKQGAAALSAQVGVAGGYLINTTLAAALPGGGGAQVVQLPSICGITTSTLLTIDTPGSGVQEQITPSAVVSGVTGFGVATVATPQTGDVVTTTIGGLGQTFVVAYTVLATDTTATILAGSIVKVINQSQMVTGPNALVLPVTNVAGAITFRVNVASATASGGLPATNAYTTVMAKTGAGTTTASFAAATIGAGTASTNNTMTVAAVNAHAIGAPVQGVVNGNASVLVPGTANALQNYLVNAFIQIR